LEFSSHRAKTSSEKSTKHYTKKHQDSSESSDSNKNKKKYKPYEEISRELKKLKPHMFNGEIEKGRRGGSLVIWNEEILPYNLNWKSRYSVVRYKKGKRYERALRNMENLKRHFKRNYLS